MFEVLRQLIIEVIRALLVDELSGRVRERMVRWLGDREGSRHRATLRVHRKVRNQLLHKLRTETEEDS